IDTNGTMTIVAGTLDRFGFGGDGGQATSAILNTPWSVALDAAGNLFIDDMRNCLIRKVNTAGIITTVAGTPGVCGYSGDGGRATSGQLGAPRSVAGDSAGNLFIDGGNSTVRKVDLKGMINTFAGTPGESGYSGDGGPATSAKLKTVTGLAADAFGNLYIAD